MGLHYIVRGSGLERTSVSKPKSHLSHSLTLSWTGYFIILGLSLLTETSSEFASHIDLLQELNEMVHLQCFSQGNDAFDVKK